MEKKEKTSEREENNLKPEQVLESTLLYSGRVVSLSLDTVQLGNGSKTIREKVSHPGAVAIVPVDSDGNILLIRQYRHSAGQILWEIPAGKLEPGEEPQRCAERELTEEIGYFPHHLQKITAFYTAPGFASEIIHLFLGTNLKEHQGLQDDDEAIMMSRKSLSECVKMIFSREIIDAKTIIGILMTKMKYESEYNLSDKTPV